MKKIFTIALSSLLLMGGLTSCKDFLNPDVQNRATKEQIEELSVVNPDAIIDVTNGLIQGAYATYHDFQGRHDAFGVMAMNLAGDLYTPDMVQLMNHWFFFDYQIDNRNATYARPNTAWEFLYTAISQSNEVITKIPADVDNSQLKAILGQALALRAYSYHLLIQRFQQTYIGHESDPGVPIYLTANDDMESSLGRGTVQDVYDRIFKDYERAFGLLEGFSRTKKDQIDQQVCAGLMARAYMCTQNWAEAQKYARLARNGYSLMSPAEAGVPGYVDIMNQEWIWGFDVNAENTNMFASFQSHMCTLGQGYAGAVGVYKAIDKKLYNSIPDSDVRKNLFLGDQNYINIKFADGAGWLSDEVYMRAPEMILIEAEAMAQQGNMTGAASVMKELMSTRDPEWNMSSMSVEDIFQQKRIELWGEGLIFYDYLRHKKDLIRLYEGSNHLVKVNVNNGSWRLIYAIPQSEIDANTSIEEDEQNPPATDL